MDDGECQPTHFSKEAPMGQFSDETKASLILAASTLAASTWAKGSKSGGKGAAGELQASLKEVWKTFTNFEEVVSR